MSDLHERRRYYAAKELLDTLYELAVGRFLEASGFDIRDHLSEAELALWDQAQQIEMEHFTHRRQAAAEVIVEVLGGVAEIASNPDNLPVKIIDHDNEELSALDDFLMKVDMPQVADEDNEDNEE